MADDSSLIEPGNGAGWAFVLNVQGRGSVTPTVSDARQQLICMHPQLGPAAQQTCILSHGIEEDVPTD